MNNKEALSSIQNIFKIYFEALSTYSEKEFFYKSDSNTWSLAQMYEHVCSSSKFFFLANTKRCLEKRNGQEGGLMNAKGEGLFKNGGFPSDLKVKVPEKVASVIIGKEATYYVSEIKEIILSAIDLESLLVQDEGTYKIEHPVFGFLNAEEWFKSLEMHSRHHLKQKEGLEALAKNA